MLATLGSPPVGDGWAFEMKWDGQRMVASTRGNAPILWSRNGHDVSESYPELVEALSTALAGRPAVVDGEIVALDATDKPSFRRLQHRMHVVKPTAELRRTTPATYYVFDLLVLDGAEIMSLPYLDRRTALTDLELDGPRIQVPPHWVDVDGQTMLDVAREQSLEGVVAKRVESTYRPGIRSPSWVKTPLRKNTEVIIAGWVPGTGMHHDAVGSLILGAHGDTGALVYIGHVGTGFTASMRRKLRDQLAELERPTSPFDVPPPRSIARGAHWVEPLLVGDVEYREYTGEGLRHPSWKGLRNDKSADEVGLPGRH
jgi:bifunctional non-homologous end joining protein LigD